MNKLKKMELPNIKSCNSLQDSKPLKTIEKTKINIFRRWIGGFSFAKRLKQKFLDIIERLCFFFNAISYSLQMNILKTTIEKRRAEKNLQIPLSEMDKDLLAIYIRWNGHHIEKAVRYKKGNDRGFSKPDLLRNALDEWYRRSNPKRKWINWAEENLNDYKKWYQTGEIQKNDEKALPFFQSNSPVLDVLCNRVSTRYWKDKTVEDDIIKKIITVGTYAPSSCNRQTWKLYIKKNEELKEISKIFDVSNKMLIKKAPVAIYITIDKRLYPEIWAPALDAGIIGLQLNLAATSYGLSGVLMYGSENFDQEEFRHLYGLPEYQFMYLIFLFGYPAERTVTDKRAHPDDISIYL